MKMKGLHPRLVGGFLSMKASQTNQLLIRFVDVDGNVHIGRVMNADFEEHLDGSKEIILEVEETN